MKIAIRRLLAAALRMQEQRSNVSEAVKRGTQQLLAAIAMGNRELATERFDVVMEWKRLQETLDDSLRLTGVPRSLVYAVDAWYLRDLQANLTPRRDEEAVYITGPTIQGVRVLSRTCEFELDEQSPVYARGNARSCLTSLLRIHENGNGVHAIGHSHPGSGPSATQQSDIDMNHLRGIQAAGANTIGLIFTRDGYVRFFTHSKPFVVHVTGKGVSHVLENVYKLDSVGQV